MQYYVIDTTINPAKEKWFGSYPEIVKYLEQMTIRAFKQTRKDRMVLMESLGHGYDDIDSVNFVRSLLSEFNIGILRDGLTPNQKVRCDITSIALFQRDEFGN